MKDKIIQVFRLLYKLKDTIAFYPSLIGLLGCILAYITFFLEEQDITKYLLDIIPDLLVNNTETARALLTNFIGGLISIMVFSFSMVMILLSQASSNFSPRLLPGLISNRRHQMVLGFYIATIIYCIFILVSIKANSNEYQLPGFSMLLAIFLMLNCLAAFIYFIHYISQEIQISNIMEKVFNKSKMRLEILIDEDAANKHKDIEESIKWHYYNSNKSGYFQNISLENIKKIVVNTDSIIDIIPFKGDFILADAKLFRINKKLKDEEIENIYRHFEFAKSEMIEDNYVLAFKQITEIALKAMSPGINDPGTALNAIDYLTQLFIIRAQKKDVNNIIVENKLRVSMTTVKFKNLLFQVMAALRTYCKHDIIMVQKLIKMLNSISENCENKDYEKCITEEIEQLKIDAKLAIKNKRDLTFIT